MNKKYKNLLMIIVFVLILGVSINVLAANQVISPEDCIGQGGVFSEKFIHDLKTYVYIPIKWAVPILLLVLTSVDFAKIVFNGKKEDMDKAKNNFLKRFVAGLIIFFAPNIVILIVDFINNQSIKSCMSQFIN